MQRSLVPEDLTVEEMILRLEEEGYVVKKTKKYKTISTSAIISFFYDRIEERFGTAYTLSCKDKKSLKDNRDILRNFQQKVIKEGFTDKAANLIAYNLVKIIFDNYDRIGLTSPISTLDFILTKKGSWVWSKLIELDVKDAKKLESSEWFMEKMHIMCSTDDERLEELKKQREKELLFYHAKEKKTNKED